MKKSIHMTQFEELKLKNELLYSLKKMKFKEATEVQEKAIPLILNEEKDEVVRSKTGSAKTGAFLIPIIEKLKHDDIQSALIITPSRELALQVFNVSVEMATNYRLKTTVVYGGASIENQIRNIRKGSNIIVGTPGRLIDLLKRGELKFNNPKFFVLDEADIMLDMGFIEDIELIMSKTPRNKQSMLFSATMPEKVLHLAKRYMRKPVRLDIGKKEELTVRTISHSYALSDNSEKVATLLAYINEFKPGKSIIFSHTKRGADILYHILQSQGFDATVIHGDLTQAQREKALSEFRKYTQFMIATNVAARGLDITDVSDIINFDTPDDPNVYIHRVGRSARVAASGNAFTIVEDNESHLIEEIEHSARIRMSRIVLNREPYEGITFGAFAHKTGRNNGQRNSRPQSRNNRSRSNFHRGGNRGRPYRN